MSRAAIPFAGLARRAWPAAIIAVCFAHGLATGWGRWGDLLVDTGRELEWPRRVLEGEALYSELRYPYGPLAPYLNALLYRVFGAHLEVLAVAGAASAALAVTLLYLLARRFIGRVGSTLAAIVFLYGCCFAHLYRVGIFNWVLPYSYSATYGMLASLASLYLLVRHVEDGRSRDFHLSVVLLAVAALSKLESFAPALSAHAVFSASYGLRRRMTWRHVAAYGAGFGGVGGVLAWFLVRVGPALWREAVANLSDASARRFALGMSGMSDVAGSLMLLAKSLLALGAIVGFGIAVARVVLSERIGARWKPVSCGAACLPLLVFDHLMAPDFLYLASPALMIGVLGGLAAASWRVADRRQSLLPDVLLWSFALASMPRIVLAAAPPGYGFYLFAPGILCLAVFLFGYVPRLAGMSGWRERTFATVMAALLAGNAAVFFLVSKQNFDRKTVFVSSARGGLWSWPDDGEPLNRILDAVRRSQPEATLLVVPTSSVLNFLSQRHGCDDLPSYLPVDVFGAGGDAALRDRWQLRPPSLVVWITRRMSEFQGAEFGATYAQSSARWLLDHYAPATDPRADLVLLRPRPRQSETGRGFPLE